MVNEKNTDHSATKQSRVTITDKKQVAKKGKSMMEFISAVAAFLKLEEYHLADWLYFGALTWALICIFIGQRTGKLNVWDMVTATDANGVVHTDGRKFQELGAFVVMTVGFSHLVVTGKITEWYAGIYVSAFVTARWLRDREQRLNREMGLKYANGGDGDKDDDDEKEDAAPPPKKP